MAFTSYTSSYSSAYSTAYNANAQISTQANQSLFNVQTLSDMAAAARAKRLDSLLGQLSGLIEEANANVTDPLEALMQQAASVDYVLARLRGEEPSELPGSLSEFAYELEDLIGDILVAWDALRSAGDLTQENSQAQNIKSIDGILSILEGIASRRIERMVNSLWYMQWRNTYRNTEIDLSESGVQKASFGSLPQGVSQADAQEALGQQAMLKPSQLFDFLQQAIAMTDPSGIHLLSQEKQDRLHKILSEISV